ADEHDDGVLTQDRPQPGREGQAALRVHLNLVHAAKLIFDRVFDRDDLAFDVVDLAQGRVEGCGLARSGRPGDQDDAVRHVQDLVEMSAVALGHAEMLGAQDRVAAVEDSQHDRFAVDHRDDRDADVDLAAGDFELDAAVLRQALFGDVQVRQNLDAADDGGVEAADGAGHVGLDQHAVDAVAKTQLVLERLDVNVGGAGFNRLGEDLVHETDDRGVLGGIGQVQVLVLARVDDLQFGGFGRQGLDRVGADA